MVQPPTQREEDRQTGWLWFYEEEENRRRNNNHNGRSAEDEQWEIGLVEWIESHVKELEGLNRAPRTITLYREVYRAFDSWLSKRLNRVPRLRDISAELAQTFLIDVAQGHWPPRKPKANAVAASVSGSGSASRAATANKYRRILKALFEKARRRKLIRENPLEETEKITEIRRVKQTPTREQVLAFLEAAKTPARVWAVGKKQWTARPRNPDYHDMALLIANTGLRENEALGLEVADINPKEGLLEVRSKPWNRIKDKQERTIRLNRAALSLLKARVKAAENAKATLLFRTRKGTRHRPDTFTHRIKRIAVSIGLPWLGLQALRRFFATYNRKQLKTKDLQEAMGHSSVRVTEGHYIGAKPEMDAMPLLIGHAASHRAKRRNKRRD